jgi:hypothetical protein
LNSSLAIMPEDNRRERWWGHALEGLGELLSAFFELFGESLVLLLEFLSVL